VNGRLLFLFIRTLLNAVRPASFILVENQISAGSSSPITDIHRLRKPMIRSTESGAAETKSLRISYPFPDFA
jgi:hypothetical protein